MRSCNLIAWDNGILLRQKEKRGAFLGRIKTKSFSGVGLLRRQKPEGDIYALGNV